MKNMYEDCAIQRLLIDYFFYRIRADVYIRLRETRQSQQWKYIIGQITRDEKGYRVSLTRETQSILNGIVEYYQGEGLSEIQELGISEPDHYDDVISWIREAPTNHEMSHRAFRVAMRQYRDKYGFKSALKRLREFVRI
ncbi:MAG: hypothetical protein Q7R33_07955 [Nitrosarchaeum sp.]|nr:hypothetical protein [Nitrosarchaeum sp.]